MYSLGVPFYANLVYPPGPAYLAMGDPGPMIVQPEGGYLGPGACQRATLEFRCMQSALTCLDSRVCGRELPSQRLTKQRVGKRRSNLACVLRFKRGERSGDFAIMAAPAGRFARSPAPPLAKGRLASMPF